MIFRKKIQDLLTLGASNAIASIILSLFWLYLATLLEKHSYGELGFLMSIANVGSTIALLGLRSTVVVYESKNVNILPAAVTLVFLSSIVTGAISFILTNNIILSFLLMGMAIFAILISGLNSKQKYKSYSVHRIIRSIVTVASAIILYQIFGLNGILLGYFIGTLFIVKELHSLIKNKKVEFNLIKSKMHFTITSFVNHLTQVFFLWGDKIVIGSIFGFSFLGSYHLAAQYLLLLDVIPRTIVIYLTPQESKGEKNKNIKLFSIAIACVITVSSFLLIPEVMNQFMPEYSDSIIPMQILSLAVIPLVIIGIKESEFMGKENNKMILYGNVLQSGAYLTFIITLGPIFGLFGVSLGLLVATILRVIFLFCAGHFVESKIH